MKIRSMHPRRFTLLFGSNRGTIQPLFDPKHSVKRPGPEYAIKSTRAGRNTQKLNFLIRRLPCPPRHVSAASTPHFHPRPPAPPARYHTWQDQSSRPIEAPRAKRSLDLRPIRAMGVIGYSVEAPYTTAFRRRLRLRISGSLLCNLLDG